MPIVCKKPKCVLSKDKTKCIKPNPYVQFISYCGKTGKTSDECKDEYYKKTNEIKKNACDYYENNKKVGNIKSCPKSRRPVNNKCPDDYPVAKLNKHKVKCCYKDTVVKKTTKKEKKPLPISSDHIPIKQLKRRAKKIESPFTSAESGESIKQKKRTSTPFSSAESGESRKQKKRSSTPFSSAESGESRKQKKRTSTPFSSAESGESRKQKKRSSTPFSSAESIKSPVNPFKNLGNEEANPFKQGDKIYKLAKVQKYRGRLIPTKVERRRFPAHKIQEVLKELEKPREMAELTQSSLNKKVRRSVSSRKTISAPSFIKYQKNQKKGFIDWLKGKQNKPPSQVIDSKLNKKIEKVYQLESDKRHREQYKDLYKKGFNRKEIELLLQADIKKGKKGRSLSLSKKAKERKLSNPDLKFAKPQKKGFFDLFKRKEPAPSIDSKLNKRIEMVKQQESNKRHREQYKEFYNKGLNRKEIELLKKVKLNKKEKKGRSLSLSKKAKERKLSAPDLKFEYKMKEQQKPGLFDWFKGKKPEKRTAPDIDDKLNERVKKLIQEESNKRHREQYKDLYNKGLNRKEIELLNEDLKKKSDGKKARSTSFSFGNKEKNRYRGHISAPETISLNKGPLRFSVPSLDTKAKEYFDKKLTKKIEGIKSKVSPKKQKGWFQTLFGNESSSKSEEKKQNKKWYEY